MTNLENNIYCLIAKNAMSDQERVALRYANELYSYKELFIKIDTLSFFLKKKNLRAGDKILLAFTRGPESLISILCAIKLGLVFVPINVNSSSKLVSSYQKELDCKFALTNCPIFAASMNEIIKTDT